nr:chromosomal replication initiator protein DnaA [Clostridia bacterium]
MENKNFNIYDIDNIIKQELFNKLSSAEYMLWIDPLKLYSIDDSKLIYCAQDDKTCNTLIENYQTIFMEAIFKNKLPFNDISFIPLSSNFIQNNNESNNNNKPKINPFISKYTFDNFVCADSNRMALTSALAVAKNPGVSDNLLSLNPLYIYGGVGLGKTHLLHAIGNYLFENNNNLVVIYSTAEKISLEYFSSLSNFASNKNGYNITRQKYSVCDVLMIDDIQFIQKKKGLQEFFFNIFNDLYQSGKQIVLASDRPPSEINDIEDRLRSRFESGLLTDISTPELDTRINIIKKKISNSNIELDDSIINYIAEKVNTNIRELEGTLTKVLMFMKINNNTVSIDDVRKLIQNSTTSNSTVDSDKIINCVSQYFKISTSSIIGKKKTKDVVLARMFAIYLICEYLDLPLINIGQIFGGRDHTTIMYSRDKISNLIKKDEEYARRI